MQGALAIHQVKMQNKFVILSECYFTLIAIVKWKRENKYCEGKSNVHIIQL